MLKSLVAASFLAVALASTGCANPFAKQKIPEVAIEVSRIPQLTSDELQASLLFGFTYPVHGTAITSEQWAQQQCAQQLGEGWTWLEYHISNGMVNGWPMAALFVGSQKPAQAWISNNDQYWECYEAGQVPHGGQIGNYADEGKGMVSYLTYAKATATIEWFRGPLGSKDTLVGSNAVSCNESLPLLCVRDRRSDAEKLRPNLRPDPEIITPVAGDPDGDGLTSEEELSIGTDPQRADSDGDGYSDSAEVRGGYNPLGSGLMSASIKEKYLSWPRVRQAIDTKYLSELRNGASMLEQYYGDNMTYGGSELVGTWEQLGKLVAPTTGAMHELMPGDFDSLHVAIASGSHVDSYCMWVESQVDAGKFTICTAGANCAKGVSKADAEAKGCKN